MGVAGDWLALAYALASPPPSFPEQASLRRAVSSAYYALFHLLVVESAECWNGPPASRQGLQRAFEHGGMKRASQNFSSEPSLPVELRNVAKTFVELQQARHAADYDHSKSWTRVEALGIVAQAGSGFRNWRSIRTSPIANEYLLALLIGKKRGETQTASRPS